MKNFYPITNHIRDYSWGDTRLIPEFLDIDWPTDKPAAEVWMGAHPSQPSSIHVNDEWIPLDRWIKDNPQSLGQTTLSHFGRLPFLFKLLAAGKSLSIQAHPDKKEAEEGFARENAQGIRLDSPVRNYKDDNHKPEIIMALTPFTAMIGFRSPQDVRMNFSPICKRHPLNSLTLDKGISDELFLKNFLDELLCLDANIRQSLLADALDYCHKQGRGLWDKVQLKWVKNLSKQFPDDVGALGPLFLNVIEIAPGAALYQPAKILHAYLDGLGVELMANSDNVLRGGLTPKNIDVAELLKILRFETTIPNVMILDKEQKSGVVEFFATPAREFSLGIGFVTDDAKDRITFVSGQGPAIFLNIDGHLSVEDGQISLDLRRGECVFVPHWAGDVFVRGNGRLAVAAVGR